MLAVLLFLGAATAGFGVTRVAAGRPALPSLGARAAWGTGTNDVVLVPRVLQVTEPDGTRPARFTVNVPQGWWSSASSGCSATTRAPSCASSHRTARR